MKDSFWIERYKNRPEFSSIEKEMDTNIAIIGAGLTGLTCAYYLSNISDDIMVIEADRIGASASGRNTGKVTSQHGLLYYKLMNNYDKYFARMYYHANEEAMNSIEDIISQHQIECGFKRCDAMLYTTDVTKIADLQDEYQTYLDLHIPCNYIEKTDTPFPMEAGLLMHYQAKFDPYAYAVGLSSIISKAGIDIYEHSPVSNMIEEKDGTYTLLVNDTYIHANKVIFATQFPFIDHGKFFFARMYCEQETILCSSYDSQDIMALSIDEPMHSYNTFDQHLLICGNAHKSGQKINVDHKALAKEALQQFELKELPEGWTSSDYVSFDQIPFVGKLDKHNENVLFASGFSKWGNTTSNLAGKLLSSYVLQQRSTYRMLFSPQRYSDIFTLPFVKENMNVAYEFIKGKFKNGDDTYPSLKEGKLMQIDNHTYGVYRDEFEELFILDVTCPHLGCVCNFNTMDKTWDCPCHGSRFSYKGDVIKGPAEYRLHSFGEGLNRIDPHIKNE